MARDRRDVAAAGQPPPEDQEHLRTLQRQRRKRVAKVVAVLALAVVLIVFILTNSHSVRVSFVFATSNIPLIWVMFACAVLGALIGYLVGRPERGTKLHEEGRKRFRT
jgi:uncharacterized integral membrane protein